MSYESLAEGGFVSGTMLGSGGFIAYDEDQCIVRNTQFHPFLPPTRKLRTMFALP